MAAEQVVWLIAAHFAVSLFAGAASWLLMPGHYRTPRGLVIFHHFLLAWFLPVLGAVLVLVLPLYARLIGRRPAVADFRAVRLPEFTAPPREPVLKYGVGSIRSRLTNLALSADVRLKALLTVQAMPGNLSTRLLREVLSDPADDLRLTAYGMLDRGEKYLNQTIQTNLKLLEGETDATRQAFLNKQLAMNYWELVYQGFAQGELRAFSLNAALRHARAAMQRLGDDADLWVLVGRIALEHRDLDAAEEAFGKAQRRAVRSGRINTYLAELAFLRRDFATVRKLIGDMSRHEAGLSTEPLRAFWTSEART